MNQKLHESATTANWAHRIRLAVPPRAALFLGIAMLLIGCTAIPRAGIEPNGSHAIRLDHGQPTDGGAHETIVVEMDPVYKSQKRYRGITFAHLLDKSGYSLAKRPRDATVEFLCKDGYTPFASLSTLILENAFVATEDLDAPSGQKWIPFEYGGLLRDPGEFYLVWPGKTELQGGKPWPYGIVALRIGLIEELLAPAIPQSQRHQRGFKLFRENCMSCHSINGVGGTIAIDLNVPLNVFEYWQADKLLAMIANPASFRRNAKMPSFANLGQERISDILLYVRHMKSRKTQPPIY